MPISDSLPSWLASDPWAAYLVYGLAGLVLVALLLGLWLLLGRGPRRHRAFGRAQYLLQQGAWEPALAIVRELQERGPNSPAWQARLQRAEGECHRAAGQEAVRQKQ